MRTYNQILKEFIKIFNDNKFIKDHRIGDIFEIDFNSLDKTITYPYVCLVPQPSALEQQSIEYNFSVIVMDLVDEDEFNEFEVLSDCEQIGFDIISAINNNREELKMFEIEFPITRTPFTERFNDRLAGWTFDITLRTRGNININDCV